MAAAVNLIRDARVFFTTNLVGNKVSQAGNAAPAQPLFEATNTWEIQVLDGLSFSQSTGTETVTMNESGTAPVRGQRVYNTTLDPVDFSFSTYVRPAKIGTASSSEERFLWNALSSFAAIGDTGAGWVDGTDAGTDYAEVNFDNSNKNQLQQFGLIIAVKGSTIVLNGCSMEGVTLDFGIDSIATLQWSGRALTMETRDPIEFGTVTGTSQAITSGGLGTGAATYKVTDCAYLANKLSVSSISYTPVDGSPVTYDLPITGGSLQIANNLTYLTPSVVGAVNTPIASFTGSRTFTGSLTAYLRASGTTGETGDLLADLLSDAGKLDRPIGNVTVNVGGSPDVANTPHIVINAPTAVLQIPTVNTDQVVGITFGFTPQGSDGIDSTDELIVKYSHPE